MRAAKGGQTGINGERYKGGQFLPNSEFTVKGENKRQIKARGKMVKVEVAPYCFDCVSSEFRAENRTLFDAINSFAVRRGNAFEYAHNPDALAYYGRTPQQVMMWIERFNAGERWMPATEFRGN